MLQSSRARGFGLPGRQAGSEGERESVNEDEYEDAAVGVPWNSQSSCTLTCVPNEEEEAFYPHGSHGQSDNVFECLCYSDFPDRLALPAAAAGSAL